MSGRGDSKARKLIVEEEVYEDKVVCHQARMAWSSAKTYGLPGLHSLKRLGHTRHDDGRSIGGTG